MTPEQIEQWRLAAEAKAHALPEQAKRERKWADAYYAEFARLVRADALETAARMCESEFPSYYGGNMQHFRQCAVAIRAEAAKETT